VHKKIAPAFIERVLAKTKALRQQLGPSEGTEIAAMSSELQLEKVERQVDDAVSRGAEVLTGGRRAPGLSGPFYEPTLITGVDHSMPVMCEETFGPVLPIMTFETDDEAVQLANDSDFGLTASVWTKDIGRGRRLADRIEAGTVMVNEVLYTHGIAQTPWGGVKQSGLGRTHGKLGLLELVTPQHVHVNRLGFIPDLWWFGYTPVASKLFRGLARRFASGSLLQTSLLLPQMLRRLREGLRK
jgi:succinate-semialdehyde dehydrogenase/glutarate-semialdehyde dehydrogenase